MASLGRDLLAQARVLANREPRRPKQSTLRRAVSTAYYALFHLLIDEGTALIIGGANQRLSLRHFAARSFIHGRMKNVCEEFRKSKPRSPQLQLLWPQFNPPANADLSTVVDAFVQLQEQRHDADYNLSRSFTRSEAMLAVGEVAGALEAWSRLKRTDRELALFFALSLMIWPGLSGR